IPATVKLTLGQNGECSGLNYEATVELTNSVKFLSAASDYGQINERDGLITLSADSISPRQEFNLFITILPTAPGWVTNHVHIQIAPTGTMDADVAFLVIGEKIPELRIDRNGPDPDAVELTVLAQAGRSYVIERSPFPSSGSGFSWSVVTSFVFAGPTFQ